MSPESRPPESRPPESRPPESRERRLGSFRRLVATVRFRVTALATLVVVAMLVVTGAALVAAQDRLLRENLADGVEQRADDVAALLATGRLPEVLAGGDDTLVQVTGPAGEVVAASPALSDAPAVAGPPPPGRTETVRTVEALSAVDEDFRVLSRRIQGPDGPSVLHVAASLGDVEESTDVLTTVLTLAVPAVAVVLAALVWWLVGRTLRPVEAIRVEVADIGGAGLHRRVPDPGGDDEIARLARTMNAMLDRVESAVERQQRFVADASHELRSPLTRVRSELEVDLAHPDTADPAATRRSVLAEVAGLQRLVDGLLHLARSDGTSGLSRTEPVDLDDIVLRHAEHARADGKVTVDISDVTAAQVQGDAGLLSRAVGNLVDNAVRHAAATVTLTLTEGNGDAVLTVADDGPGIPPDQRERVFERFARLDDARHSSTGGSGLGLAITRDVVERHGGTVTIDPDFHQGARLVVTLPLTADHGLEGSSAGTMPG